MLPCIIPKSLYQIHRLALHVKLSKLKYKYIRCIHDLLTLLLPSAYESTWNFVKKSHRHLFDLFHYELKEFKL